MVHRGSTDGFKERPERNKSALGDLFKVSENDGILNLCTPAASSHN